MMFSDDEQYVSSYDKVRGHIVIPRFVRQAASTILPIDMDNTWLLRNAGLLGDFVGQFGAPEMVAKFFDMAHAENGVKLKDVLLTPIASEWEKLVGGLNPAYESMFALAYGAMSMTGNTITLPTRNQPSKVVPVDEAITQNYGVGNEYNIVKAAWRPGHAHQKPEEYLSKMFLAISDRMEAALTDAHSYVNRFNRMKGKEEQMSVLPTSQLKDLRYWARRGEYEEFRDARLRWLKESDSHNYLSFRSNLAALDPARRVGLENVKEFVKSLDAQEAAKFEVAQAYQHQLMVDMWKMWRQAAAEDPPEIRERLQASEDSEITSHHADAAIAPITLPKQEDHAKARAAGKTIAEYMKEKQEARLAERTSAETWIKERPMLTTAEMIEAIERQRNRGKISVKESADMIRHAMRLQK